MDVEQNRAEQVDLYGAPLGELLSGYAAALGLSQAKLAELLGLSAPMLSQLMNARRVRIGNPVAVRRLQAINDVVDLVQSGKLDAPEAIASLKSARDDGDVFTRTVANRPYELAVAVRSALHQVAPASAFERAAQVLDVDHKPVADALRALAGSDENAAAEFIARKSD